MDSHKTHKAFIQMAKRLDRMSGHNECCSAPSPRTVHTLFILPPFFCHSLEVRYAQTNYHTQAIITRGLYTFHHIFDGQKGLFKELFS